MLRRYGFLKRKDKGSMTMLGDKRKFFGIWYSAKWWARVEGIGSKGPSLSYLFMNFRS